MPHAAACLVCILHVQLFGFMRLSRNLQFREIFKKKMTTFKKMLSTILFLRQLVR